MAGPGEFERTAGAAKAGSSHRKIESRADKILEREMIEVLQIADVEISGLISSS